MHTLVDNMIMNGWLTSFLSMSISRLILEIRIFQALNLTLRQGHGWGQRAKVIQSAQYPRVLTRFLFISQQSDQQFERYSYFEIWPWNIQDQDHEWGLRWRSQIITSVQPMYFLFVSHQSDQSFLRCGQNNVWPWKNTSEVLKENLPKITWQQNFSKI